MQQRAARLRARRIKQIQRDRPVPERGSPTDAGLLVGAGATGLEPATSGVTDRAIGHDATRREPTRRVANPHGERDRGRSRAPNRLCAAERFSGRFGPGFGPDRRGTRVDAAQGVARPYTRLERGARPATDRHGSIRGVALTRAPGTCGEPGCAGVPVHRGRCREHARWPPRNSARMDGHTTKRHRAPARARATRPMRPMPGRSPPAPASSTIATGTRATISPRTSSSCTPRATRAAADCTGVSP